MQFDGQQGFRLLCSETDRLPRCLNCFRAGKAFARGFQYTPRARGWGSRAYPATTPSQVQRARNSYFSFWHYLVFIALLPLYIPSSNPIVRSRESFIAASAPSFRTSPVQQPGRWAKHVQCGTTISNHPCSIPARDARRYKRANIPSLKRMSFHRYVSIKWSSKWGGGGLTRALQAPLA